MRILFGDGEGIRHPETKREGCSIKFHARFFKFARLLKERGKELLNSGRGSEMNKLNCWEVMKCGKGPGGYKVDKSGTCPVATETSANGLNGGINGGRICWVIATTSYNGNVTCYNSRQISSCFDCKFHNQVMAEEGLLKLCRTSGFFLLNVRGRQ